MPHSGTLGIIAGAGELPIAIARAVREDGRDVFLLALEGIADSPELAQFRNATASMGQIAAIVGTLKNEGCEEVTLAGRVARPDFSKLRLDRAGAQNLPRVLAAALKGDDALLRAVIAVLEKHGLRVVGSADVTRSLLAGGGALGALMPSPQNESDIAVARRVVAAMGELDIGQAAVICDGLVLAVEAAEGTDAMLSRVAALPPQIRGSETNRRGVLVKAPKPGQELRVDLPVIGVKTVEAAAAAGLAGIAVAAGAVLILNREGVAQAADRAGLFVFGFSGA